MTASTQGWVEGQEVAYPGKRTGYVVTTITKLMKKQGKLATGESFVLETGKLVGTSEYRRVLDMTIEANQKRVAESKAADEAAKLQGDRRRRLIKVIESMGNFGRFENLSSDQVVEVADAIERVLGQVDQDATEKS